MSEWFHTSLAKLHKRFLTNPRQQEELGEIAYNVFNYKISRLAELVTSP